MIYEISCFDAAQMWFTVHVNIIPREAHFLFINFEYFRSRDLRSIWETHVALRVRVETSFWRSFVTLKIGKGSFTSYDSVASKL